MYVCVFILIQETELVGTHNTLTSDTDFESSTQAAALLDPDAAFRVAEDMESPIPQPPLTNIEDSSLKDKDTILAFANTYSVEHAAERFGVSRATIRTWIKSERLPFKPVFNTPGQGRKITYSKELDLKIADWVKGQLADGHRITVQDVCQHARGLIQEENPDFTGSTGWAQRFLTRNNIDLGLQVRTHTLKHTRIKYFCTLTF